ncbi:aldo/keto reductase [Melittangium boletus DSM 14713]|uniref:Aldo/keto reductase n=2 Tax=Melittangium boletus TaxID=83453 RepID=A0A250ISA6_9BACT|nr:aldo/keto reductase [Melittangium boletus]ATB34067.1 aldo/keto reductase [Melittangium boletus DSM 14713]
MTAAPQPHPLASWLTPRSPAPGAPPAVVTVGTMNFGTRTPAPEAQRIVARALERGVPFFDTANSYNHGESERILGRALAGQRGRVGIATKVGLSRTRGKPEGLEPTHLVKAVEESLRRLGTDYVDVIYLHAPDAATPVEDTLTAVRGLLQAGKARHWGVSNHAAWQLLEMRAWGASNGLPPPALSQVLYNPLVRLVELEYLPFARRYPVHTTVFNPLAGGLLSGRYGPGDAIAKGSRFDGNRLYQGRYWSERLLDMAGRLRGVAESAGLTLVELAYGWLAGRPGVDSVLAGPGSVEHLDAALEGCARPLPAEVAARVDEAWRDWQGTDASYVR